MLNEFERASGRRGEALDDLIRVTRRVRSPYVGQAKGSIALDPAWSSGYVIIYSRFIRAIDRLTHRQNPEAGALFGWNRGASMTYMASMMLMPYDLAYESFAPF